MLLLNKWICLWAQRFIFIFKEPINSKHQNDNVFKQEYRNQFIVSNDDYGYFPASRDGKEGYDIRLRGAQWQSDPILDNEMPDRFPDFEPIVTEYINSVAALGKILLR